jgi:hypothetical protein
VDQKTWPPSLCEFISLITYQFSLLLFACLACLRVSLRSPTLAPRTLLAYQHTWLSLFFEPLFALFTLPRTVFVFFSTKCFLLLPPLGLVTHFSLFPTLFTFLTSFSQLALCLLALCVASVVLWSYGWVGLTGCVDVVLLYSMVQTMESVPPSQRMACDGRTPTRSRGDRLQPESKLPP